MAKKTGFLLPAALVVIILLGVALLANMFGFTTQTALPGSNNNAITNANLGDASALTFTFRDKSADNSQTAIVGLAGYSQTSKDNGQTWTFTEDDGTVSDGSGQLRSTSTVAVGTVGRGIGFNSTYSCVWTDAVNVGDEAGATADIECFRLSTSLQYRFTNATDVNGRNDIGIYTIPASSSDGGTVEVKVNDSNVGYWFGGVFFDLVDGTNLSTMDLAGAQVIGSRPDQPVVAGANNAGLSTSVPAVSVSKNSESLASVTTDDFVFTLSTPVILLENDKVRFNTISFTADGDGFSSETVTMHTMRWCPFRSTVSDEVLFGYEDDATSPTQCPGTDAQAAITLQS